MPQPTVQDVYDAARSWLNDNGVVTTGEAYLNAGLQAHFATAYRKMYDAMAGLGTSRIRREFYYLVPAYTSLVVPVNIGVTDMSEPEIISERGSVTSAAITSTSTATPISVTQTAHGYSSNSTDVVISGVTGTQSPWGRWFVTVIDPNTYTLNGSVSDGNAGTGGTASISNEKFITMDPLDSITDRDLSDALIDYVWEENVLKFRGSTQNVQIRVQYIASGAPPANANTVIGIDNCLNFLGSMTAAHACGAHGWTSMSGYLRGLALGSGERDGSGGFLRDFVNIQVKKMQRTQRRRQPFRRKRAKQDIFLT